jgi:hypothetical protein
MRSQRQGTAGVYVHAVGMADLGAATVAFRRRVLTKSSSCSDTEILRLTALNHDTKSA